MSVVSDRFAAVFIYNLIGERPIAFEDRLVECEIVRLISAAFDAYAYGDEGRSGKMRSFLEQCQSELWHGQDPFADNEPIDNLLREAYRLAMTIALVSQE